MIKDRVLEILKKRGMPNRLHRETGIDRDTWNSIKYGRQKINEEHLEALYNVFPDYKTWLATGLIFPDDGQINPSIAEKKANYSK
jgi:hypothetical protein